MDLEEFFEDLFIPILLILIFILGVGGCTAIYGPKTETTIVEDANGNVINKIISPIRYGRCR